MDDFRPASLLAFGFLRFECGRLSIWMDICVDGYRGGRVVDASVRLATGEGWLGQVTVHSVSSALIGSCMYVVVVDMVVWMKRETFVDGGIYLLLPLILRDMYSRCRILSNRRLFGACDLETLKDTKKGNKRLFYPANFIFTSLHFTSSTSSSPAPETYF